MNESSQEHRQRPDTAGRDVTMPQGSSVRYVRPEKGGVSHFNYLRGNALLSWMHARLFVGFWIRLPLLISRKLGKERKEEREKRKG
jgi:hypothetical protein